MAAGEGTFVLVNTHTFIYDGWHVIEERPFHSSGTLTAQTRRPWGDDVSGSTQGAGGVGGLLMAEGIDLADIDPHPSLMVLETYLHD